MPETLSNAPAAPNSTPAPQSSRGRHLLIWIVVLAAFAGLFYLVYYIQSRPNPATVAAKKGAFGTVSVTPATAVTGVTAVAGVTLTCRTRLFWPPPWRGWAGYCM